MSKKSRNNSSSAGKGDSPRNCFSQEYRDNYDSIIWSQKFSKEEEEYVEKIKNEPPLYISSVPPIN